MLLHDIQTMYKPMRVLLPWQPLFYGAITLGIGFIVLTEIGSLCGFESSLFGETEVLELSRDSTFQIHKPAATFFLLVTFQLAAVALSIYTIARVSCYSEGRVSCTKSSATFFYYLVGWISMTLVFGDYFFNYTPG